jgi:hypothetical protein
MGRVGLTRCIGLNEPGVAVLQVGVISVVWLNLTSYGTVQCSITQPAVHLLNWGFNQIAY